MSDIQKQIAEEIARRIAEGSGKPVTPKPALACPTDPQERLLCEGCQ